MTEEAEYDLGREVTGRGLKVIIQAISPSLMPGGSIDGDQLFPTSLLHDLFGADEDWLIRGEQVGAALMRELGLKGVLHSERAVASMVEWLKANHPDATDVRVISADYKGIDVSLRLDYNPLFLEGLLRRLAWGTRGKDVKCDPDDQYRFHMVV